LADGVFRSQPPLGFLALDQLLPQALLGPLALDDPGQNVGHRTEEALLRGRPLVALSDVQVQQPDPPPPAPDGDAVMAVRPDARVEGGVALVDAAGKHDVVVGNGPPAQAGAEPDPATGG
jgi:hypothetical protein